jgi:hypothetical protein
MTVDARVLALHEALKADHEEFVAEIQRWADAAAAGGDAQAQRGHLAHIARLRAIPKPWERHPA